jgi:hypothetical protein
MSNAQVKLLIVDDDASVRTLHRNSLRSLGSPFLIPLTFILLTLLGVLLAWPHFFF